MFRRTLRSLLAWSLALAPAFSFGQGAWGGASYLDPDSFPRQARAKTDEEGQIVLTHILAQPFPETVMREEKRERIVKEGDVEKIVEEKVAVPATSMRIATYKQEYRVPLTDGIVFDLEGKPVKASAAAARLKKGATVLFASKLMPSYYLTVFKPDTLFLTVGPESQVFEAPMPLPPEEGAAPGEFPPSAPPPITALPDEGHPVPPQVALAKAARNLVLIRSFVKDIEKEKMFLEETADDGTVSKQEFDVETETVTDIERRFPAKSIKATRADGKPVPAAELAKLLASSRCVLLAGDAKKVDPSYLEIVRPDALILHSPKAELAPPKLPPGLAPALPGPIVPAPGTPVPVPEDPR